MGLKPAEFWAMTPREFSVFVRGWGAAQKITDKRLAWLIAYVVSPWLKKKITPAEILGERVSVPLPSDSRERFIAHMNTVRKQLEDRRAD